MPDDTPHSCDSCIFCSLNPGYVDAGMGFTFHKKELDRFPFLFRVYPAHAHRIFRPPDKDDFKLSYQSKSSNGDI